MITVQPQFRNIPVVISKRIAPGFYQMDVSVIVLSLLSNFMRTHPNIIKFSDISKLIFNFQSQSNNCIIFFQQKLIYLRYRTVTNWVKQINSFGKLAIYRLNPQNHLTFFKWSNYHPCLSNRQIDMIHIHILPM